MYKFNELQYPTTSQGLEALIIPSSSLKNPYLFPEDGYISSLPLDPWGREYIYEFPPRKSKKFDLYTLGSDGMEGGTGDETDIGNWMQ
jgi:general secretion pathway protein G